MGKTKGIEVHLRVRPTKKPFTGLGKFAQYKLICNAESTHAGGRQG